MPAASPDRHHRRRRAAARRVPARAPRGRVAGARRSPASRTNGPEAQALLDAEAPDVAFLDIRMPGLTGLDVARAAEAGDVAVVFVTAYDEYAVDAFERAAVDYLLKPVSDERLAETVARLKARIARRRRGASSGRPRDAGADRRLGDGAPAGAAARLDSRVASAQQVRLIAVDDVCYFQANDKYTSVFTADGEALIRTPLKELAASSTASASGRSIAARSSNVRSQRFAPADDLRDLAGRVTIAHASRRPENGAGRRAPIAHVCQADAGTRSEPDVAQWGCEARKRWPCHTATRTRPRDPATAMPTAERRRPAPSRALASRSPDRRLRARRGGRRMDGRARLRCSRTPATWSPMRRRSASRSSPTHRRRPPSERASYGYGRAEVLAAFVNAIAMLAVVALIAVEAVRRLLDPQPVAGACGASPSPPSASP